MNNRTDDILNKTSLVIGRIGLFIIIAALMFFVLEGVTRLIQLTYSRFSPAKINREFVDTDDLRSQLIASGLFDDYDSVKYKMLHPFLRHTYYPNQNYKSFTINKWGYRGVDFELKKKDNVKRLVLLGGSVAFGYGATSDETTICGYLKQMLRQENTKYEVINLAVQGYKSIHELFLFETFVLKLKPDILVILDGYNDLCWPSDIVAKDRIVPDFPIYWDKIESLFAGSTSFGGRLATKVISASLVYNLMEKSAFIRFLKTCLLFRSDAPSIIYKINNSDDKPIIDAWVGNINNIALLSKTYAIKPVVFMQPIALDGKKLTHSEKTIVSKYFKGEEQYKTAMVKRYNIAADSMRKTFDKAGVLFIDGRDVFNGEERSIYFDIAHFSDLGNKLIARKICEHIDIENARQ